MTGEQQTEIYSHLGVALEPLISYLIPNINFVMALTKVKKADVGKQAMIPLVCIFIDNLIKLVLIRAILCVSVGLCVCVCVCRCVVCE